jgi:hypothetical protein
LAIWIDEFFFAEGETDLLREAVAASNGSAAIVGSTHNRVFQLKSYQQAARVDVMWTGQQVPGSLAEAAQHLCMCSGGTPPARLPPHPRPEPKHADLPT